MVILFLLAALSVPVLFGGGAVHATDDVTTIPDIRVLNGRAKLEPGTFRGADGQVYAQAPETVPGKNGHLQFGADFDAACARGKTFDKSMDALAKLARIIDKSGRKAIWTLGYNKTGVLPRSVDMGRLPHGKCDRVGLKSQAKTVRDYQDPNYLSLANQLASSRHPSYFKTDPHWSTVGGAVFAKALATRLDRKLGKRQRYTYSTEQRQGMLNSLQSIEAPETATTASPTVNVRPVTRANSEAWSGYPELIYDYSWKSFPARRTYPGRTLVLGDSFSMFALDSLRVLFKQGRWMWYYHCDLDDVIDAIVESDTVVIEIYQLFTAGTTVTERSFFRKLKRALR